MPALIKPEARHEHHIDGAGIELGRRREGLAHRKSRLFELVTQLIAMQRKLSPAITASSNDLALAGLVTEDFLHTAFPPGEKHHYAHL